MERLCPTCGQERGERDRFCAHCGREFEPSSTPTSVANPPNPTASPSTVPEGAGVPSQYRGAVLRGNVDRPLLERDPVWRAAQSPVLVAALVFATFNLYAFWWLGRTWWQIKQEDGDPGKHPLWHALAMVVPIYGYFRFYAHMRAIVSIAATPDARAALSPGATTLAWIVINILDGAASAPASPIWLTILASGLGAALIGYAQSALNATWASLPGGARRGGSHPLHWLLLLLGALVYVLVFLASLPQESA